MSKFIISGFYDEYSSSLDKQIKLVKEFKESYLCPRNINKKNIADYSFEEFKEKVYPILKKEGIKFSSIGSPIGKVSIDDEEGFIRQKKQLKELVKIANLMECKYIRIFSFFYGNKDPNSVKDIVIKKLREFLEIVKGSGVKLLHENEKKIYGDVPERVLEIKKEIDDENLTFCFDASNYVQCDIDVKDAFNKLKDITEYYHIKDCSKYKVEVPVGLGEGQYKYIFEELNKRNYEGFITMEPHTFKYAVLKPIIYFVPFVKFIKKDYFKAFRLIDKGMNVNYFSLVNTKKVFVWQHDRLKNLLKEVGYNG